eukprot:gene14731-19799_t
MSHSSIVSTLSTLLFTLLVFLRFQNRVSFRLTPNNMKIGNRYYLSSTDVGIDADYGKSLEKIVSTTRTEIERKELWKQISALEKQAVELLSSGSDANIEESYHLLSKSQSLKSTDSFIILASLLASSVQKSGNESDQSVAIMTAMKLVGAPPHISALTERQKELTKALNENIELESAEVVEEEVDSGSTFSDTVTEKIRVKVSSFYDSEKSDPANGKYMFWYKVGIYNEGPEPVQIVARMWEIEKCKGDKEVVRGAGIMSTQPIIPPGDVFTYQSVCPLKVFPPKGKRVLGSMSGAYTMCKGNMGQHNFTVKVSKFNLILPEAVIS